MEYFITAILVVGPLFLKLLLGFLLKQTHLMSTRTFTEMNNVVFRVFLPLLIFTNIYQTDLEEAFSLGLIEYAIGVLLLVFIAAMLIIPRLEKVNQKRGVLVQAICRSNFIIFGLPVASSLYGEQSLGTASILIGLAVPLMNTLSVITLEYYRGSKPDVLHILKGIGTNPIILGALCAFILLIAHIRLPFWLEDFLFELARIATPLALIILGGSVSFTTAKSNRKQLLIGTISRLVFIPLLGLSAAVLLGFRDIELVILMALFGSPSAVSSYTMAIQMEGDGELAGQLVVFTTLFSIITIFFWTYLLLAFGFI